MFHRARSRFTSRSGSPSVQPRSHGRDWGKRPKTQRAFYLHLLIIRSLSLHIRRCISQSLQNVSQFWMALSQSDRPKLMCSKIITSAPLKQQHCVTMQYWQIGKSWCMLGNECPAEGEGPQFSGNGAKAMDSEVMKSL